MIESAATEFFAHMSRVLLTDPCPSPPTRITDDLLVITPSARVARLLGVRPVSLREHAVDLVKRNGWAIATPLVAASTLRIAISRESSASGHLAAAGYFREMVGAVLRSGVDLKRLAASTRERPALLGRVTRQYVRLLETRHMIDSEAALATAHRLGLVDPQKTLIYGYFRARGLPARPEELNYIERLSADGSIYYLPCGDGPLFAANSEWRDYLLSHGWEERFETSARRARSTVYAAFAGVESSPTTETVEGVSYPTIESEVRGTLARAKAAILDGASLNDIAIVCRQPEQYAPLLRSTALEYGVPLIFEHRMALAETNVGRFISLLLETAAPEGDDVICTFEFESTARLLKHPAGPDIPQDRWREARRRHLTGLAEWREVVTELGDLEIPSEQPVTAWAAWLRRVLKAWSVRSKLGAASTEVIAFDQVLSAVEELSRDVDNSNVSFDVFAAELRSILDEAKTPFSSTRAGVIVAEPNTAVGCRFKKIFVIGMCEGGFPVTESDDPLIDHFERKRLAADGIYFQDALEVPRWEAMSFYFALLAADEAVLSYSQYAAGKERLASPYFDRISVRPIAAPLDHLSCAREARAAFLTQSHPAVDDAVFEFAKHQFQVEADRVESGSISEYNGILDMPIKIDGRPFSVSQLTRLGQCPFKWFAGDLLRLRSPDEAETEFAANRKGSLYHKVLEIAVRENLDAADIRAAILTDLEQIFERAEAELEYSFESIPNWELRRAELLQTLRDLVASEAFLPPNVRILETEVEFRLAWNGLTLRGKIDRIDATPDGFSAVDYKSGTSRSLIKDESGRLKIDIQLPIYGKVALANIKPGNAIAAGRYISISACESDNEKDADLEQIAGQLKEIFQHGRFAIEPDTDGTACRYCDHAVVCRFDVRRT
jgi:RecB family exonuclease